MISLEHGRTKLSGGDCSATIISKRHILTAAHCVITGGRINKNPDHERVSWVSALLIEYRPKPLHGRHRLHINFTENAIQSKYYIHPSYSFGHFMLDDIAVIEFPEGTNLNITPVTLVSNYFEKQGHMAITAGYGIYKWNYDLMSETFKPERPDVLQNATVPVHTNAPVKSTVIATASVERHSDHGDSGGPLMIERNGKIYQIGVASQLYNPVPGILINLSTRLSLQCDWITKVTKSEVKCEKLPDDLNIKPPVNPVTLNPQPGSKETNKPATKRPSNLNGSTTLLPGTPQALKKPAENSCNGFALNILLFLFIGVVFFA